MFTMDFKLSKCTLVAAVVCLVKLAVAFPLSLEHDGGGYDHGSMNSYHFEYAVNDPVTGDVKSQNEVSDGRGTVKGTYSLLEADGSTRVVEYTADDVHGFRAEVKHIQGVSKSYAPPEHRLPATYDVAEQPAPVHDARGQVEDQYEPGQYETQPGSSH
ncbi:cuticle protein 7-like [Adelges cooleyi]|uniref:cuticle protein 7-like n=1 Tax=Adelges cooleyi TaxID=133065 RepID=UPI00217F44E0|nr:cuticle protein 7-like [Adelges cooleyi]